MSASSSPILHSIQESLSSAGLALFAVVPCSEETGEVSAAIWKSVPPTWNTSSLVVVGHLGRALWPAFQSELTSLSQRDPLDEYSLRHSIHALKKVGISPPHVLYPGETPVPLQSLLREIGWSHASPLGIGIHPRWGLWQAVRAVLLVDALLPPLLPEERASPCLSCEEKPCMTACPAAAVREEGFLIEACVDHRLQERSPCAPRCLARQTCPVGVEHQYSSEQRAFHSGHSLEMIKRWSSKGEEPV